MKVYRIMTLIIEIKIIRNDTLIIKYIFSCRSILTILRVVFKGKFFEGKLRNVDIEKCFEV